MTEKLQGTYIAVDQLCVGIYVYLDVGWLDHSFPLNSFKIKDNAQITAIRQLGLTQIRVNPARSDCRPLPLPAATDTQPAEIPPEPTAEEIEAISAKKTRIERLQELRDTTAQCEKQFLQAAGKMKDINRIIFSNPKEAHKDADELIVQILSSLVTDKDIAIHLMNDKVAGEDVYFHSMNVAVLSMMLGKELGLSAADIKHIGVGCLFHDIGKVEIPAQIVKKIEPLTRPEQNIMQQHCDFGVAIVQKIGLPKEAIDIVRQHHEYVDGSGYPNHLAGEEISKLARIVTIVNAYDNLCNQPNPKDSLSPYEALSLMFSQQRKLFDGDALNMFIRCMGVYPPGTIVSLSNDVVGMVVSVNSGKPLRPNILIYDPDVPKNEAIILDMQDVPEINVGHSLKPNQLSREVYDYLSPRKRMAYFFDAPQADPPKHN